MRNNWVILLLVLSLAASAGCTSRKQTVRGGEGEGGSAAGGSSVGSGGAAGQGGAGADGISSETIAPEKGTKPVRGAGSAGGQGGSGSADGRQAAVDGRAGIGATQEGASPFQDILFDFDQSVIRDDAKPILAGIAGYIAKNSVAQLIIEGHCDSRGTAEYNMALGERRAEAARRYLAALGVKPSVLVTVSYGKEKPFTQGDSEEAWARNRRGHFLVR